MSAATGDAGFSSFARRLTRGYVVLALILIIVVAGTSTFLAFTLYARTINDTLAAAMTRAVSEASYYQEHKTPFKTAAHKIVDDFAHSSIMIAIYNDDSNNNKLVASNFDQVRIGRHYNYGFVTIAGFMFGLHPFWTRIVGGEISIDPDWDRISDLLAWYWAIVLPVSALAVIAAWYLGRRITRRAIAPLVDVTSSLHRIAGGDFQPEPLIRDSGELGALIAAYNDVAYRLTAASNEREQNALQMRRFIADAGHELRTPLTIIMGYLDVLLGGVVRDSGGIARIHGTMLDEGRRMKALVDKLIFLARLDRPESTVAEPIDINGLVLHVVRGLDPIAGNRIELHLPSTGASLVGDETEIAQAIENIVQNALKYAPESPVTVNVTNDVTTSRIEIIDRGPGMSAQDVAHAFDRFYRGTSRGNIEGSGLGLAIAKRAVERVNGTIALHSAPGEGTTIILELPTERTKPRFLSSPRSHAGS